MVTSVEIPVAAGELLDKITILEIKAERISEPARKANVSAELDLLRARCDAAVPASSRLDELVARLRSANERLWDLEDAIRDCERRESFGAEFIEVARRIYRTNDERAAIKRDINSELGSLIVEEKSYTPY